MILWKWWAVAACIVALSGSAHAQPVGNGQQGNSQKQDAQPEKAEPKTPQTNIRSPAIEAQRSNESPAQTKVYEPDCRKPKDQTEADLCVQRRVADAAEEALHWTKIQTGGALIGLVLVLATLVVKV
ncbi:hypothetical protein [Methylobacterium sp. Leaf111]|uniref:hypothetical protein n=1 Tax=Methylobacterium sp. Leaf111 TaxID=1736257 RepID=UPI000A8F0F0E|nr:hypothetical protein [Methylobacterium sp. Leaf111]